MLLLLGPWNLFLSMDVLSVILVYSLLLTQLLFVGVADILKIKNHSPVIGTASWNRVKGKS